MSENHSTLPEKSMDEPGLSTMKSVPELLQQGVQIYKSLKEAMQQALGLRQYAEHLSHITQILKEANKFLDEKEQALANKLNKAYCLSQKGMDKATLVVSVIKAQSEALVVLLTQSDQATNHQKLCSACKYFSTFAKDVEHKVEEAVEALGEADSTLFSAKNEIRTVVNTLKRVQENFLTEVDEAKAKQRAVSYGGALVGLVKGPIGAMISFAVTAAFTEFYTIPKIKEDFEKQQKKFSEYIDEFEGMHSKTMDLKEQLDTKRKQLIEVQAKLCVASNVTGAADSSISLPEFHFIGNILRMLVQSCDEFLKTKYDPVQPRVTASLRMYK